MKKLGEKLDKCEQELRIEDFEPEGIALMHLNEVISVFKLMRKVLDV